MAASFRQKASVAVPTIERLECRRLLHAPWELHVQFGPSKVTPAEGFVVDSGLPVADHANDVTYGWLAKGSAVPVSRRAASLASPDSRFDSFVRLKGGAVWQVALPNGNYEVHLAAGDPVVRKRNCGLDVESVPLLRGEVRREQPWIEATAVVTVTDGKLEITAPAQFRGTKLSFLDITAVHDEAEFSVSGDPVPAVLAAPTPAAAVLRVNCGTTSPFIDSAGNVWSADNGSIGGGGNVQSFEVADTADDLLY
jgi:hypothetical protein